MNQETDLLQLHLHQILKDLCTTQAALAKYLRKQLKLPISSATVCLICRYDSWPRRPSMGYEVSHCSAATLQRPLFPPARRPLLMRT